MRISAKLRPLERAAFFKTYAEKGLKNIVQGASGAFGNAATRLEAFTVKGGIYAYGNDAELDALFLKQAGEIDLKQREATLHKMQQWVHERARACGRPDSAWRWQRCCSAMATAT